MQSFGEYLQHCRKTYSDHSATSLAKAIGKTKQYIYQIEKNETPPPAFELCLKICDSLALPNDIKTELMRKAFFQRIQNNRLFYDYPLNEEKNTGSSPSTGSQPVQMSHNNESDFYCVYYIRWTSRNAQPLLTADMQQELRVLIEETVREFRYTLLEMAITSAEVNLTLQTDPEFVLSQFVKGVKDITNRQLKTIFPELKGYAAGVWDASFQASTVKALLDNPRLNSSAESATINRIAPTTGI